MTSLDANPYALAGLVVAAMTSTLAETRGGVPDVLLVHPGATNPPAEMCEMGWATIRSITPSDGSGPYRGGPCGVPTWQIGMRAGVYRCYPLSDDGAMAPLAALDSAVRDVVDDAEAIRRAICTAYVQLRVDPRIGVWQPVNPMGGVHGGATDFTVTADVGLFSDEVIPPMPEDPRFL